MSIETRILCDGHPGGEDTKCLSSAGALFPWHTTATKIRKFWRSQDWHRTKDGRDICPKCWEEGIHRGNISPNWCDECDERKPCGCEGWTPLPGEENGDDGFELELNVVSPSRTS